MVLLFSTCTPSHQKEVDELNARAYSFHYRNLDSTKVLARKALSLSSDYDAGQAEALNNLAFVCIVKMDYRQASRLLDRVVHSTDNQIELSIAYIQQMRLCQRESRNKDFYDCRERALYGLHRIDEDSNGLSDWDRRRMVYARSEFNIVSATYFYYTGQPRPFIKALDDMNPDETETDTAQYLNYLYNIGAGGAITQGTPEEIAQSEFDYLMRCYFLATEFRSPYWEANALQAISEHMQTPKIRNLLINNNLPAIKFLNSYGMPYRLLPGNLAQRSLDLFMQYGDVYQIAGAYRTLAQNFWAIGDYRSAAICLENSLHRNKAIFQAPDLVASIREQLSLVYSAIDDKPASDYNRNIYLDLQEQTRQDRMLEARAGQLDKNASQLNIMILAVVLTIVLVITLLFVFDRMRRNGDRKNSAEKLLEPLRQWKSDNELRINTLNERYEQLQEDSQLVQSHILQNKKRNLEQRAKVQLVVSVIPFIDRILNEIHRLKTSQEKAEIRSLRYQYIAELTDKINDYNGVLTHWIQLRQGQLSLHIESFPLESVFDIVRKGRMGFQLRGIDFTVERTTAVIKADRTLTLFMINTMADNARRFVPQGGRVTVAASEAAEYVEISVSDTGKGMSPEQVEHLFDHKAILDDHGISATGVLPHHGFGLLNCKGIIEAYKKVSSLFRVCSISAESQLGKGSRFSFRLPKGVVRRGAGLILFLLISLSPSLLPMSGMAVSLTRTRISGKMAVRKSRLHPLSHQSQWSLKASAYADSTYFSNINGHYRQALLYADSARYCLNAIYHTLRPQGKNLMKAMGNEVVPAEIQWFRDSLNINYTVILDVRNESAVACLALHLWNRYDYNNKVYTQLFREVSADNTLDDYVQTMQKSENSKTVSVILLVLLLLSIFPAYYFLYYRHRVFYRFCVERVKEINQVLLGGFSDERKLKEIERIWRHSIQNQLPLHAMGLSTGKSENVLTQLDNVVSQICTALQESIQIRRNRMSTIETAADELARVQYEDARLHVSNSVLDNCLSTIKHETMYYPSRIRQLISGSDQNLEVIGELAGYYRELYGLLSAQALRQTEGYVRLDCDLLHYLFEVLRKAGGGEQTLQTEDHGKDYVYLRLSLTGLQLTDRECRELFTPLTRNLDFLLCRQIVREVGEVTNLRACGIQALLDANGKTVVEMILPKKIWINLK